MLWRYLFFENFDILFTFFLVAALLNYNSHTTLKAYNAVVFSILIDLCNHHRNQLLEHFYHPENKPQAL